MLQKTLKNKVSFREFLDFYGYCVTERKSPAGGVRKRIADREGEVYEPRELFDAYTRFGGMPMLADLGLEIDRVTAALIGDTSEETGKKLRAAGVNAFAEKPVNLPELKRLLLEWLPAELVEYA